MNIETRCFEGVRNPVRFKEAPTPSETAEDTAPRQAPAFQWQRFDPQNPADRAPLLASAVTILEDGRQSPSEKQRAIEALRSIGYGWDRTLEPGENLTVLRAAVQHEKQRERQRQEQMANTEAFQKYYRENIAQHAQPSETPAANASRRADGPATYREAPRAAEPPSNESRTSSRGWRGLMSKASTGLRSLFGRK